VKSHTVHLQHATLGDVHAQFGKHFEKGFRFQRSVNDKFPYCCWQFKQLRANDTVYWQFCFVC